MSDRLSRAETACEKTRDFTDVVPLRSLILISVLAVPSRCNVLSNLLTTWTFTTLGRTYRLRKSTCAGNEMRVVAVAVTPCSYLFLQQSTNSNGGIQINLRDARSYKRPPCLFLLNLL
ncbi:hypothetical protein PUN28_003815 [Cardiocondyla obscurior]|uniref:Uncharacterized protein n=1 Tax=Cardiocondyla obscurior TaxID=286306 RepID=A0AAW2GKG3_9HYME